MTAECHRIDTTEGVASFATARVPAWHRLGTVFERPMTAAEAMDAAHLKGWNVRTLPMTSTEITDDGVTTHEVADWFHVVRDNPVNGKVNQLGVVGKRFVHVQNEEHVAFLEALLDMSGAQFIETAGSLREGRQVFYTAKLPEPMLIGGVDRHDLYVATFNGHDGSMALRVIPTPVRVVCANTQRMAIKGATAEFVARHTKGATSAVAQARQALDLTFKVNAEFEAAANRMINEAMTAGQFEKIVDGLFARTDDTERKEGGRAERNRVQRFEVIRGLWEAPTQAPIAGTRWAAYNALTEYADWFAGATGKTPGDRADNRAASAFAGEGAKFKANAFAALAV